MGHIDTLTIFFPAEHHTLYQYSLVDAKDHYMGLIQTETVGLCIDNGSPEAYAP